MQYKKVKYKLKRLTNNKKLNEQIIRKVKKSFVLYDLYKITNLNGLWHVIKYEQYINSFDSSATAVSWCLADNINQFESAYNLVYLDRRLQQKKIDIDLRKEFLKSIEDKDRKVVAIARLSEDLYTCQSLKIDLSKYYVSTKYMQIQDFIT